MLFVVKILGEGGDDLLEDRFSKGGDGATSYHDNFKNNSTVLLLILYMSFWACFLFLSASSSPSLHDILLVLRRLADNLRGRKHRSQETFSDPV